MTKLKEEEERNVDLMYQTMEQEVKTDIARCQQATISKMIN